MPVEIERKFLVTGTEWRHANGIHFCQGYLSRGKGTTVRVRIAGERGYLTIKGVSKGTSRAEFEYEIPVEEARQLLKLCEGQLIQKVRYVVKHEGTTWEVDEFMGENAGLVVAEVELQTEDQQIARPAWLGQEVTQDTRYFNSSLSTKPYSVWRENPKT